MSNVKKTSKSYYAGYAGSGNFDWHSENILQIYKQDIKDANASFSNSGKIFLTGGNVTVQHTRPQQNTFISPRNTTEKAKNVSKIILGEGIANITGSINFDMSHKNLSYFLDDKKIKRNTYFHFAFSDGNDQNEHIIYHNVWNSINFASSAGGLVSCSIDFNSINKFKDYISDYNKLNNNGYFENLLIVYWQSGMDNPIESFSITFSQDVSPVYLNNQEIMPSYLRCGSFGLNAQISSFIQFEDQDKFSIGNIGTKDLPIHIGNKTIEIKNALIDSKQISQSGVGDICKYNYTFNSYAIKHSNDTLFEIK